MGNKKKNGGEATAITSNRIACPEVVEGFLIMLRAVVLFLFHRELQRFDLCRSRDHIVCLLLAAYPLLELYLQ